MRLKRLFFWGFLIGSLSNFEDVAHARHILKVIDSSSSEQTALTKEQVHRMKEELNNVYKPDTGFDGLRGKSKPKVLVQKPSKSTNDVQMLHVEGDDFGMDFVDVQSESATATESKNEGNLDFETLVEKIKKERKDSCIIPKKASKWGHIPAVEWREMKREQLLITLSLSAQRLCKKHQCGVGRCIDVYDFKARKTEFGNYTFTKLHCTDEDPSQEATAETKKAVEGLEALNTAGTQVNPQNAECEMPPSSPGYLASAWSYVPSFSSVCSSAKNVVWKTGCAVAEDMMKQPIASALNPARMMQTATQAFIANVAIEGWNAATGAKDELDYSTIPILAEDHLRKGKGVFTEKQAARVRSWVQEANTRLQAYDRARMEEIRKLKETTSAVKEQATVSDETESSTEEKTTRVKPVKSVAQPAETELSLQKMLDQLKDAAQSAIISKKMIEDKKDTELLHLLRALQDFILQPYELAQSTRKLVDERFEKSPPMGSDKYVAQLKKLAHMVSENADKEPVKQSKKVIVLASGPGTGKTTGLLLMAQAAGVPLCKINGEEIQKMLIPEGKTVFNLIEDRVAECVKDHFVVDGKKVVNGVILFDDFHYLFNPGGRFQTDLESRKNFFSTFVKNAGNPEEESIVDADFSHGEKEWPKGVERKLPTNTQRVQFMMTLNEFPPEISATKGADAPTLERVKAITVDYLTREERQAIGWEYFEKDIFPEIEKQVGHEMAKKNLNLEECKKAMQEVVKADIEVAFSKARNGTFGFRGLVDLLAAYRQHVLSKITKPLKADICSLTANPPFDAIAERDQIQAYKGEVNENMRAEEDNNQILTEASQIRNRGIKGTPTEKQAVQEALKLAETQSLSASVRKEALGKAKKMLGYYSNLIEIPSPLAMRPSLDREFGYLKVNRSGSSTAQGNISKKSSNAVDMDRFKPLTKVIGEVHSKLVSARPDQDEKFKILDNPLVRVHYTDPEAQSPILFDKMGSVLGGLPVYHVSEAKDILDLQIPQDRWKLSMSADKAEKMNNAQSIRISNYPRPGENYTVMCRMIDKLQYFGCIDTSTTPYPILFLKSENFENVYKELFETKVNSIDISSFDRVLSSGSSSQVNVLLEGTLKKQLESNIQMTLWDELFKKHGEAKSVTEALIPIHLNKEVTEALTQWHYKGTPPSVLSDEQKKEVLAAFQNHLTAELNSSKGIQLKDGSVIDLRRMTVALISAGDQSKKNIYETDFDKKVNEPLRPLDLTMGAPPMEGRAQHARGILDSKLDQLLNKLKSKREKDFGKITKLTLDDNEKELFESLIQYDRKIAEATREHVKERGGNLPLAPLEAAVSQIAAEVESRVGDYFQFDYDSPSLESMKPGWKEIYKTHRKEIRIIKDAIKEKAKKEELRIQWEADRRASQEALRKHEEEQMAQRAMKKQQLHLEQKQKLRTNEPYPNQNFQQRHYQQNNSIQQNEVNDDLDL